MLREADLTPPPGGLQWGMSQQECLTTLAIPALRQDERWIEVNLPLGNAVYEARLWTDNRRGLQQVQVVLGVSADFPEESWNSPDVEAARADYEERYRRYIAEISGMLGAPGGSFLPEPTRYEVGGGLTYWDRPTGRVELALYHDDKHAPFELYLSYSADTFPV